MSGRSLARAAVAVAVLAAAAACAGTPEEEPQDRPGARPGTTVPPSPSAPGPDGEPPPAGAWRAVGSGGFVYLLARTGGSHHEVFRADVATGEVEQVTAVPGPFGVSSFSASAAGLVVAEASTLVDHVALLGRDGRLTRLRPSRASSPDINHRGDVLAYRPTVDGGADMVVLRRRGLGRWVRVTRPTSAYTTARWLGPDTVLVVRPGRRTTWRTLTADGRRLGPERLLARRRLAPEVSTGRYSQPVVLHGWGRTPPALWTPGQRPVPLPDGWTNACLSPDGRRVLLLGRDRIGVTDTVTDTAGRRPVAVVADPAPPVLSCAWVDRRFGPG